VRPPLEISHREVEPGVTSVAIYENGMLVTHYMSFHGFNLDVALKQYRRARQIYGPKFSLPFKGASELS
jgi:hypothetical protein